MAQLDSSTPDYTLGSVEEFARRQRRHTAENRAAHLLPFLKPGHIVLDFGCGAGGISVGLAKAIEPGELHGVDMEQSQINMARAAARDSGHRATRGCATCCCWGWPRLALSNRECPARA